MSCTAGSPSQKTLCFRTACLTGGYQRNSCCWPWLGGPKWALVPKLLEKACGGEVAWACDQHESCLRGLLAPQGGVGWADSCQEDREGALCSLTVGFGTDLVSQLGNPFIVSRWPTEPSWQDESFATKDATLCWKCSSSAPLMLSSLGHACCAQP